ncbi:hypothetical protein ACJX0J_005658 [Zea mays]
MNNNVMRDKGSENMYNGDPNKTEQKEHNQQHKPNWYTLASSLSLGQTSSLNLTSCHGDAGSAISPIRQTCRLIAHATSHLSQMNQRITKKERMGHNNAPAPGDGHADDCMVVNEWHKRLHKEKVSSSNQQLPEERSQRYLDYKIATHFRYMTYKRNTIQSLLCSVLTAALQSIEEAVYAITATSQETGLVRAITAPSMAKHHHHQQQQQQQQHARNRAMIFFSCVWHYYLFDARKLLPIADSIYILNLAETYIYVVYCCTCTFTLGDLIF